MVMGAQRTIDEEGKNTASASREYVQDPDLWYGDGSVILVAENTGFKVYSGILSQSSFVFGAILCGLGGSPAGEVPVFEIQEKAEDLRTLLRALHDTGYFEPTTLTHEDYPFVLKLLRISSKYSVKTLRGRCISLLERWYPSTLDAFLAVRGSQIVPSSRLDPERESTEESLARHISIANAARELNLPILLPSVYMLTFCMRPAEEIWDGTVIDGVHYEFNDANKRSLFLARQKLSHIARTKVQAFWFYPHPALGSLPSTPSKKSGAAKCKQAENCGVFKDNYTTLFDTVENPWMDPFMPISWEEISNTTCGVCWKSWQAQWRTAVDEVWKNLPKSFGLPTWEKMQEGVEQESS